MKHIILVLLTLFFISCSVTNKLNRQLDRSQKASLKDSPFETASGMTSKLKVQKKYRIQYEEELNKLLAENMNDTIILIEKYDFICIGCPADNIQIFIRNKLIQYNKQIPEKNYRRTEKLLTEHLCDSTGYCYSIIIELKKEIAKGFMWNSKPENFGTDNCFGGGHTFYSVIYPNGEIESMYMRCWMPKEFRNEE
ncbi:hypothetical protein [Alkalitalea saponilacus]|uniref:Lipoprotein n=1 Tax=Alkalitalea saponilacus TaxID=889453 RepID=A0A1T5HU68_9BACT|nr:hypothetical protein [Alkalitalea saponilacus]ASB50408.1 hypothetical protein CDL62_15265 [Alkalitalea saponilacus]SKC24214.1 hypothetical protein SAMN03080601_03508 [Alkalitalea saponilacus]